MKFFSFSRLRRTVRSTACKVTRERRLGPPSPILIHPLYGEERMAGFSYPGEEGCPGRIVAPWQRGGGLVGAVNIPPIRCDPPDEAQAGICLQRDGSPARTGGIEAGLFILLGRTARFVRSGDSWGSLSILRHAALIAKTALSGSVVTGRDHSLPGRARKFGPARWPGFLPA